MSEQRVAALRWIAKAQTLRAIRWRDRFFRRVHPEPTSGCFLWGAGTHGDYGLCTVKFDGRVVPLLAHRVAYVLEHGAELAGVVVRHSCDNPACVNPRHLRPGTQTDNCEDMYRRGRARPWGVPLEARP